MAATRQALAAQLGHAVQRYQRSVQAFDDAVGRRLGLGPADLRCLDWLTDGPLTAGQLQAATGLRSAATTALITRLEARELVERVRDDDDRRVVRVQMTERGRDAVDACYQPLVRDGMQLMAGLSDDDLAVMRDYLDACTALTDRHRAGLREPTTGN